MDKVREQREQIINDFKENDFDYTEADINAILEARLDYQDYSVKDYLEDDYYKCFICPEFHVCDEVRSNYEAKINPCSNFMLVDEMINECMKDD